MSVFKVVEIFDSIDGEGIRAGMPVSFIRLAGCNLRCSYCDTLYALFGEKEPCEYTEMSTEEIVSRMNTLYKRATLTGGEPLINENASELVNALTAAGFEVNIETNGAVDINAFSEKLTDRERVFFTVDYKTPSSGESEKMLFSNYTRLRGCDVIKFVVGDSRDTDAMLALLKKTEPFYEKEKPHIFIGTVFGSMENSELCSILLREPLLRDARIQLQLHKYIWEPDKKGV